MKKLLAILLTLALMLPLCGLAEKTAPQATLTTITFRDFNGRALVAEMKRRKPRIGICWMPCAWRSIGRGSPRVSCF